MRVASQHQRKVGLGVSRLELAFGVQISEILV